MIAHGYEGSVLAKLCAMVMAAYRENRIKPEQVHVAKRCLVLAEGFVAVGITALIDEATGYQEERELDELDFAPFDPALVDSRSPQPRDCSAGPAP